MHALMYAVRTHCVPSLYIMIYQSLKKNLKKAAS
jgi:hypothetical protein